MNEDWQPYPFIEFLSTGDPEWREWPDVVVAVRFERNGLGEKRVAEKVRYRLVKESE